MIETMSCSFLISRPCATLAVAVLLAAASLSCAPAGAAEPHNRFIDSGDGTVVDQSTGLRWQKCSFGQTYTGGLCSGTAIRIRWHDAVRRCREAGEANSTAGDSRRTPGERSPSGDRAGMHSELPPGDWRLPVRADLESLLIYRPDGARPFIDLDFFPSSYPLRYWSGTSQIDEQGTSGVVVNFLEGTVYTERAGVGDSDGKNYVRCVDTGRRPAAKNSSFIERK